MTIARPVETAPKAPFDSIVSEHGARVLRVCRAVVGPADADDAWSDTFLAALRAYPNLADDANVEAWLVTIAHRKAIDLIRGASRRAIPVAEVPEEPTNRTAGRDVPRTTGPNSAGRSSAAAPSSAGPRADPVVDQHRAHSASPNDRDHPTDTALDDELADALARLPDKQRLAVAYHHLGGLPYAEVAQILGGSTDAARRAAADGVATLRRTYRPSARAEGEPR